MRISSLTSCFNPMTWNAYIIGKRLPTLIYKNSYQEASNDNHIVDIIRCRKRALEFSAHELPIFCVLDDVKPLGSDLQLGDFNFVTRKYVSFISQLWVRWLWLAA